MQIGPVPKSITTVEGCNGGRFVNDTARPVTVVSRCTVGANAITTTLQPGEVVRFFPVTGQTHKLVTLQ